LYFVLWTPKPDLKLNFSDLHFWTLNFAPQNEPTFLQHVVFLPIQVSKKFLICEIADFTPCAHAKSDIQRMKYVKKTDD